uniref:Transposase Helix-turn-helix domain-containing protein n=1 Tax=Knipowitschia caucasica TaxID=637954 RepID=A0AAV2JKK3_KNICA
MKQSSLKRSKRAKERKTKRERGESAAAPLALRWQDTASEEATDRETLTAPSQQSAGPHPDDSGLMKQMRAELQRLRTENTLLKEELKDLVLSPDSLRGNDAKVKYYTGVSYDILMTLYTCVEARIPQSALSTLTPFEMLIMVLMKLRLDLGQQDLAYRFSVSTSCVSKVFLDVVHVLFVRLRGLVLWPDRVDLLMSMPMEFRKDFGVKSSPSKSLKNHSPDEGSPDEDSPDGDSPDGDSPDGDSPDENSPDGESPDEDSPDGTLLMGLS